MHCHPPLVTADDLEQPRAGRGVSGALAPGSDES